MKFADIESWTYEGNEPSVFTFVTSIALSSLEDKWIRLSAETQRKLLGFPVFGKMEFKVTDGDVLTSKSVCFGTDREIAEWSWLKVKEFISMKKRLDPTT